MRILEKRFISHPHRHENILWENVMARLTDEKLSSLLKMEISGGEPDVIGYDEKSESFVFCDCAPESPVGRRSLCYDDIALEKRRQARPQGSVLGMCEQMGIELLDEVWYRRLQQTGEYDTKTSSWILTPKDIREKGGALFGDRRYGHVFIYHNSAESYYSSRGFRGLLKV
ncbi:DUF4256 domain-containing protein [Thermospira aquatica]|uniref:DUF4256 domain-containing protein n=1 Tax=Thermospira aquatica TaxID=2828656 RepID=A0AAX3BGR9_9SPIR|nr:DUF4256 domain-containing protein [Thermospira aquatica]